MSKRWEDDEDEFDNSNNGEEFWMEFTNQDAANMIEINQQQNFDLAHKQLNLEVMEKAIKITKSRWIWWQFASHKSRIKAINYAYRRLLNAIHKSL
jgi:hypothetical protein